MQVEDLRVLMLEVDKFDATLETLRYGTFYYPILAKHAYLLIPGMCVTCKL